MPDDIKCDLNGAVARDGVCYLGDAPVVTTATELKEDIDKNSAEGKETLVFFTANWCSGCRAIKPFVKEGSGNVPSSAKLLVCDTSYMYEDACISMASSSMIPSFEEFEMSKAGSGEAVGHLRMFNYYLAGDQLGLAYSFDSPLAGDISRFGVGIVYNLQTPLMTHDVATQFGVTAHFDGDEFKSVDIEAKIYSPTIGDLIRYSPVRFLGLYAATGMLVNEDGSVGMKNAVGVELLRGNLMGWLIAAEAGIFEFDPFSHSQEWFPSISLTVGHSL